VSDKFTGIKFYETQSSVSRVVKCGQTDRYGEDNRRIVQLLSANAPKIWNIGFRKCSVMCVYMYTQRLTWDANRCGGLIYHIL
jgi:hypothetical protein